jgi:hypothetical protein
MSASDYSALIAVRQENGELRELITQLYKIIIKSVVDDKEARATVGRRVRQSLTSYDPALSALSQSWDGRASLEQKHAFEMGSGADKRA